MFSIHELDAEELNGTTINQVKTEKVSRRKAFLIPTGASLQVAAKSVFCERGQVTSVLVAPAGQLLRVYSCTCSVVCQVFACLMNRKSNWLCEIVDLCYISFNRTNLLQGRGLSRTEFARIRANRGGRGGVVQNFWEKNDDN